MQMSSKGSLGRAAAAKQLAFKPLSLHLFLDDLRGRRSRFPVVVVVVVVTKRTIHNPWPSPVMIRSETLTGPMHESPSHLSSTSTDILSLPPTRASLEMLSEKESRTKESQESLTRSRIYCTPPDSSPPTPPFQSPSDPMSALKHLTKSLVRLAGPGLGPGPVSEQSSKPFPPFVPGTGEEKEAWLRLYLNRERGNPRSPGNNAFRSLVPHDLVIPWLGILVDGVRKRRCLLFFLTWLYGFPTFDLVLWLSNPASPVDEYGLIHTLSPRLMKWDKTALLTSICHAALHRSTNKIEEKINRFLVGGDGFGPSTSAYVPANPIRPKAAAFNIHLYPSTVPIHDQAK
ncbi:hypothetical protein L249_6113 [Ophiocordyceps polyrhachis-furcata BCC 54312]|uniref:Uncharacterized protein n=1 Tax=Ophiocordyceps polyrhachis-furcata BCC 54312 TaxID=1330021 RepID=A0A367LIN0_9HYPO|nr:hypothetical protein L249_6113 [Ophiocordyceps polyrhachis-furcata BCC 54312]